MTTRAHLVAAPRAARIAVATIFFANGVVVANWIARIPDIKDRLGLSEGTLGLALLCMAAGALIGQPAAGWAVSRFGSRLSTIMLGILFFVTVFLPGYAASLPTLMIALFVVGAFNGGLDVSMNAQAALVEHAFDQPIMSSFHALWSLGGLLGAALGGIAAARAFPVGPHLLIAGMAGLIVALLVFRQLVPDSPHASDHPAFALPPRSLLPLGAIAFCALLSEGAIGDWSAVYLRDHLGSSPGIAAAGFAVFALVMAIGRFTGDWLTVHVGGTRLVRGGGALVAVGIALAMLSSTWWLAIVGFGLVGAGVSCLFPVVLSDAARTPGVAPGVAIAAIATCGYSGFLVGPPVIGAVAEAITLRGALGLLALFGVVIIFLGAAVTGTPRVGQEANTAPTTDADVLESAT